MCCKKNHSGCSDNESGHQPFPATGLLGNGQKNVSRDVLEKIGDPDNSDPPDVYLYVVTTMKYEEHQGFLQEGTGPNFQGDRITLCTCKHHMRSSLSAHDWTGKWIAGFTSRMELHDQPKANYLVYLMRVSEAFESFHGLWYNNIPLETKNAKAAHLCRGGDIYQPQHQDINVYQSAGYVSPCEELGGNYNRDNCWRKDIHYDRGYGRRPAALLVGDRKKSFLWNQPMIKYQDLLPRNYQKLPFDDFLGTLEEMQFAI